MSKRRYLLSSLALGALVAVSAPAYAEARQVQQFDIPAQDLGGALRAFARASGVQVIFDGKAVRGKRSETLRHRSGAEEALRELLRGTGLTYRRDGKIFVISPMRRIAQLPAETASAAPIAAAPEALVREISDGNEIIVTAQRKEEKITDVPIAMTALSGDALDDRKIEGGSELLRAVPNVSFSKTNFSMYNFSIRGIGTQSISASSDPAVAVSFNSTPLVRNRLFEAEFFDLQRVEVLRGPQGTLYGRNATAGVVNMIPALPEADFGGEIKGEVGNYSTRRLSGMLNIPLGDTLGVRVAGIMTKRDGYDYNSFFQTRINGRDLWSTRATVAWEPSDSFRANVIWQHFEEDDNRLRTGKQLCTTDPGAAKVGNVAVTDVNLRGRIGQGCLPGSLYDDAAFGTPNGSALVYLYHPSEGMNVGTLRRPGQPNRVLPQVKIRNPLAGVTQSRNLREISSNYDPIFRAKNDVVQFNMEFKPSEALQFISQTAYSRDRFFSSQDYNRFVTVPLFEDSAQPNLFIGNRPIDSANYPGPTPGGIFCDPQLGCSDRMISADLNHSRNRQWSQEFRLQSSFDGPVNFLTGANYLDFKSQDNYYVFNNMFTLIAERQYSSTPPLGPGSVPGRGLLPCELGNEDRECPYVDPNPLDSLNNQGHNYFLSQNGVRIKSWAAFGEAYWNINEDLKLTLGARYTKDKKRADQVPSQLLLGGGINNPSGPAFVGDITGGRVNSGYPALDDIVQSWGRFTGRAVLDWKPDLNFTDDTLIYASVSRGYKGGGVNPPRIDFNPNVVQFQFLPQTFRPEYVNAFEIGTKNSFDGGRFTLNATGFFYDYKDFQVSQIVDRIAYNENFNATSWGLEFEAAWRPSRAFRVDANLGYLKTRLGKGAQSIDVMNRTQGDPDWVVLRPWLQVPSNCIAPSALVERILARGGGAVALAALCPGADRLGSYAPDRRANGPDFWRLYGVTYNPLAPYDPTKVGVIAPFDPANPNAWKGATSGAPNGGRGFYADLTGNELPNAPRLTANIGAQYTFFIEGGDWELTFRGDYYRQSKSYGRVYNTEFDRLRAWDNVNVAVTLARSESDFALQFYVKNLFKKTPITGFFVNSDDNGLTTNVFTPDPRIIGLSAAVKF
ncbi:TonB-dependent receptor [Sphingopyxis sp. LC81]|uniref:TonB-dependent receptor domain-containing protein n=1 Tax=Sphingopyxis sp. LC81 TaxID=1502850 RepID=UPI00050E9158|nr:TonB-dependent receptor [Sphingopyxis sp. LC81]KGB52709.1 TonB-dependent receptor [Sphingopyxis sp. LC81]